MPINESYEFSLAKKHYDQAKTNEEKLVALQEMLSTAPTHKGAENLRKDISRKIAAIKNKMEKMAAVAKKSGHAINIKKEGAGQVVVVGLPNSGKSTFLTNYTNAKPLIAPYPFTTTKPEVGILNFGGALIQLIELPSFLNETNELSNQIYSMIRVADAVVFLIIDGDTNQLDQLIKIVEKQDIYVTREKPKIEFVKSKFVGVSFVNEQNLIVDKSEAINLLRGAGFKSNTFILNQKTKMEDLLLLINPRASYVPAICVSMNFSKKLQNKKIHRNIPILNFESTNEVNEEIFTMLNKIIVYTKKPGEKVDTTVPLVLDVGSTVKDAARGIHKTILKQLKSAKVWGSTKYDGQTVSKFYILKNKDTVEFII